MRLILTTIILISHFSLFSQFKIVEHTAANKFHESEEMGIILREAAELFTQKLNNYRKILRAKELQHHEHIWLMALNHCLWMRENKNLSHSEKKGSKYFTGTSPSQRLAFVDAGMKYSTIGENVAYLELLEEEINDSENLPEKLAHDFFAIWKKSPGHRKNMVDKSYAFHGTVILKSGRRFYAVHVFFNTP
jgi:uncharacterized protein YkwD